jgi:hypothetical protein
MAGPWEQAKHRIPDEPKEHQQTLTPRTTQPDDCQAVGEEFHETLSGKLGIAQDHRHMPGPASIDSWSGQ